MSAHARASFGFIEIRAGQRRPPSSTPSLERALPPETKGLSRPARDERILGLGFRNRNVRFLLNALLRMVGTDWPRQAPGIRGWSRQGRAHRNSGEVNPGGRCGKRRGVAGKVPSGLGFGRNSALPARDVGEEANVLRGGGGARARSDRFGTSNIGALARTRAPTSRPGAGLQAGVPSHP